MSLTKAWIPYGVYWSTPFCRWQGSLSTQNSLELAATTAKRFFAAKEIATDAFDGLVLGYTVPQLHSFYGAPWLAGLIGMPDIGGPVVSQACATSVRAMASAATSVETDMRECQLALTCDRTSNGPHVYYPDPQGIGGMGEAESPVWDNFNMDPWGGTSMLQTAENAVAATGITREEQEQMTLLRYQQYADAIADDRKFQKRYMFPAELPKGRKTTVLIEEDEGVHPTTAEGLAKLRPALEGGSVTFGTQTYPADGNAGIVICNREHAAQLSRDTSVKIQIKGFGDARVKKAHMPLAVVPAAQNALAHAGVELSQIKAIKSHNPFAVNDVYFCKETGTKPEDMNHYGSPLIYGHPQGPTGMRVVIELIEQLVLEGGGLGLFTGCAAGDTAMAMVLKVS